MDRHCGYMSRGIHVERIMKDEYLWLAKIRPILSDLFIQYMFSRI